MTASNKHSFARTSRRPRLRTLVLAIFLFLAATCISANAQSTSEADSIHGTVLNRITHEPISRALVYSADQQYATLTDDRGHFEFKFPPQEREPEENLSAANDAAPLRGRQFQSLLRLTPTTFMARKPGFLDTARDPSSVSSTPGHSEIILYLDPESLIVGQVNIPGSEGDIRIQVELFRQEMTEGREHWVSAGTLRTLSDGGFRFANLVRGTYKLFTDDQRDPDPAAFSPELFGFPPTYYPGASDFSAASPIHLVSGTTFQVNLSVTRREYYPVKIPIMNAAPGRPPNIRVYPPGHPGPGYSLAYDQSEDQIRGILPDGSYTLQVAVPGQPGSAGMVNFSVHGATLDVPPLNLVPNSSLTVNVREQLSSGKNVFGEAQDDSAGGSKSDYLLPDASFPGVQVTLTPANDFVNDEGSSAQPLEGSREHSLTIPNVRPGSYRVNVTSGVGYVASILSGGTDLLRGTLEVGVGGSSSPIEVTLRDDGAAVTGTIENAGNLIQPPTQSNEDSETYIYFLPISGNSGQFREVTGAPDGTFEEEQVPPGTYLVLAFGREHEELAYASQEVLHKLEPQGQVIHLNPGQKEHLRLRITQESDSQ